MCTYKCAYSGCCLEDGLERKSVDAEGLPGSPRRQMRAGSRRLPQSSSPVRREEAQAGDGKEIEASRCGILLDTGGREKGRTENGF